MNLVLIYGPPTAGKLTVATELASQTGYKLLDNHRVIDYVAELFTRSESKYDRIRSELGRKIRLDVFEAAAISELDLIVTFAPISIGAHDFIRDIEAKVKAHNGRLCLIQLLPEQQSLESRVSAATRKGHKIETIEHLRSVLASNVESKRAFPDFEHLIIDNTSVEPVVAAKLIIEHFQLS